ncbi:hypothetical protein Pyn_13824 [Prunus yedoensis var. nudiflora]|uniref:Uncharacterized protein n=1 Tax=Prunus yedoensis var. nudiflora TaxID=2094558 RepID=A0A314Y659_PRUYE|nr:hypothetical protein Pyn_13824 [Prunus yedoensis var. nudiflora]
MTSHDHSNFTDTNNPRSYSTSSFKYVLEGESSEVRLRNTQKEDIILVIILEGESGVVKETIVIQPSRRGSLKRTSWHIDYIESLSRSTPYQPQSHPLLSNTTVLTHYITASVGIGSLPLPSSSTTTKSSTLSKFEKLVNGGGHCS